MPPTSSSSNNPLAEARRCRHSQRSDEIWHRKTWAGYSLLVQYYAQQSQGCCCSSSCDDNDADEPGVVTSVQPQPQQSTSTRGSGGGFSRASKRRQKKRQRRGDGMDAGTFSVPSNSSSPPPLLAVPLSSLEEDNPLLSLALQYHPHVSSFFAALSLPLPITFRMRQISSAPPNNGIDDAIGQNLFYHTVRCIIPHSIYQIEDGDRNSSSTPTPTPSPRSDPLLQQWLLQNSTNGTLARQEVGSMLPVLLMQHASPVATQQARVLDLCAAPGNKAMQVAEWDIVRRVHANDVNSTRLEAMKDAVQRSGMLSRQQNVIRYSQHDGRCYPIPQTKKKRYDIVLCDVPCSGDGTCRKDKHVARNWTPAIANQLHATQLQLLLRAMQLVNDGGIVSYSTCSLNPVENEAVVAAAVRHQKQQHGGSAVELLPLPEISGLKLRPGVKTWKVADYTGETNEDDIPILQWYDTFEEATRAGMKGAVPTMWPTQHDTNVPLEHCRRLWPQDQDTGGFFVAFLRKR